VLKSISGGAGEGHIRGRKRSLHLSLLYPYSNQVLANCKGCWAAWAWPKGVLR